MLKITGGDRRGAKLFSEPGLDTRPALARLRVCVFDVLGDRVDGATVADLFAGTGAMGLEALSRGAASCVFYEIRPDAVRRNIEKLRYADRARVVAGDVYRAAVEPADLVFVDPPYAAYRDARLAALLKRVKAGLFVVEHPRDVSPEGRAVDRREFGRTVITFYESF